jgi:SAM-dependent methyltransferase
MTAGPERYGEEIFSHSGETERARLDALAKGLDPETLAALATLPGRPDWRCLELAAGTGTVARWLTRRFPQGNVICTDIDVRYLDEQGHPNLRVLRHDVTRDGFPEASFDLVHARYLLSHLPDRDRVLADITGWVAPGGWLVIEDPALFPLRHSIDKPYGRVCLGVLAVLAERIGSEFNAWPLSLLDKVRRLGMTQVSMRTACQTVTNEHDGGLGRFWAHNIRQLRPALVDVAGVDPNEIDHALDRLSQPDFFDIGMMTFTVSAMK